MCKLEPCVFLYSNRNTPLILGFIECCRREGIAFIVETEFKGLLKRMKDCAPEYLFIDCSTVELGQDVHDMFLDPQSHFYASKIVFLGEKDGMLEGNTFKAREDEVVSILKEIKQKLIIDVVTINKSFNENIIVDIINTKLKELGFNATNANYQYVFNVIKLCIFIPKKSGCFMREAYQTVAIKYDTKDTHVERCVNNGIRDAYKANKERFDEMGIAMQSLENQYLNIKSFFFKLEEIVKKEHNKRVDLLE